MFSIPIKKLSPDAIIPQQMRASDAAFDVCTLESYILQPGERKTFSTGIAMAIPLGYYGRVAPRSGLAAKHGIDVLAGVVDAGYRGEIGVVLLNTGPELVSISAWDRIAQMIIERCYQATFEEVSELEESDRGVWGWGSSGK